MFNKEFNKRLIYVQFSIIVFNKCKLGLPSQSDFNPQIFLTLNSLQFKFIAGVHGVAGAPAEAHGNKIIVKHTSLEIWKCYTGEV